MITTTIEWHRTAEKQPDDDIPVGAPDYWAHWPAGPA